MTEQTSIVSVRNLTVDFPNRRGNFRALHQVSFEIAPGEIVGVVGESGAGKSMTGAALMGLIAEPGRITSGEVIYCGCRIDNLTEAEKEGLRGPEIGMVFQDPLTSLNPLFTVGDQLIETIRNHLGVSRTAARKRALDLLQEVGIPEPQVRIDYYPHQFSGGQRQRIVIALALSAEPKLIIADEPTSALDVSVQAQILHVLKAVCERRGASVIMITHDMGAVAEIAQRVIVMNKGRIVEQGAVGDVLLQPGEDYTAKLIAAIPSITDAPRTRTVAAAAHPDKLLEVKGLGKIYHASTSIAQRILRRKTAGFQAVKDVSFDICKGQTFGLVGESGSGKSTCARMVVGLTPPTTGQVSLNGQDIWAGGRSDAQMIFQDPFASLNPRWRVSRIIAEPMRAAGLTSGTTETEDRVAELLRQVRLDPAVMRKFPHEFSGGQRQRIAIARALSNQPEFIVCDEPTSALDVSVQAQVLDLMGQLQDEFGLTYLLISHDLAVIRRMCDHVGVMSKGMMVEQGAVSEVFDAPKHAYTRMLLDAVPDISHYRAAA